jgi:hypothetical protein
MDYEPIREVESNALVRWFADRAIDLAGWLVKTAAPYALVYTSTIDEDDIPQK